MLEESLSEEVPIPEEPAIVTLQPPESTAILLTESIGNLSNIDSLIAEPQFRSSNYEDIQFCNAAARGDVKALSKMIAEEVVDPNSKDNLGKNAVHAAAEKSKSKAKGKKEDTKPVKRIPGPLNGNYEAVKLLVANGCNVNAYDWNLVRPLHLASRNQHLLVVKFLVMSGADVCVECKSGCLPVDFAPFDSETWKVLHNAGMGIMPTVDHLKETRDVPLIPQFAMVTNTKEAKKGKKGKKGKGKKSGKRSGKKSAKKGKRKKKR